MNEIKKAIIPIAGLGTRFLPLSKVLPKELWPLIDKPVIQYVVEEAKASGINQIIFVISPEKKAVLDYFKKYYLQKSAKLEKILKERNKNSLLEELEKLKNLCQDLSFSFVFQKKPLGDGDAIFQAEKIVKREPCAVLFADDIVDSKIPCLLQISRVFKIYQKPIVSLCRLPQEKLSFYGIVEVEKITKRLYKIKKIVEKPEIKKAPSNFAISGKYILTPEVFDYLSKTKPGKKGEIVLAETFNKMLKNGKIIYGYEFEGKWLECGNKLGWLESNFYLSLKHPYFGPELKKYLKEIKINSTQNLNDDC